jgi:hypothetical protein
VVKKMEPDTMNKVDLDHSQGGRSVLVDIFAVEDVFGCVKCKARRVLIFTTSG